VRFGSLEAQVALALAGVDREEVLARLAELILQFEQDRLPAAGRVDSTTRISISPSQPA